MSAAKVQLRVPFGLRGEELFEPGAVPNGKACGCVCPACGRKLVAYNQGKVRTTQYFGHEPGVDCAKGRESALHLAGKAALMAARAMRLPAVRLTEKPFTGGNFRRSDIAIFEPVAEARYLLVEDEVPIAVPLKQKPVAQKRQPDLFEADPPSDPVPDGSTMLRADLRASNGSRVDLIEIRVTHAVDTYKQALLQDAGLRCIEVDLSRFLTQPVTLEDIRHAVVESEDHKMWISHPALQTAQDVQFDDFDDKGEDWHANDRDTRTYWAYVATPDPALFPARPQPKKSSLNEVPIQPKPQIDEDTALLHLRSCLGLQPNEPWPRHLDLDLPQYGGSLSSPRVWITKMFVDWVYGQEGASYRISEMVGDVVRRFGTKQRWGEHDLNHSIRRRVLPYWVKCGFVTVKDDGTVTVICGTLHPPN